VLAEFPTATVAEQDVGMATSISLPTLNGHRVVAMLLANAPGIILAGSPEGNPDGAISVPACTVTIYDADTGAFLVTIREAA